MGVYNLLQHECSALRRCIVIAEGLVKNSYLSLFSWHYGRFIVTLLTLFMERLLLTVHYFWLLVRNKPAWMQGLNIASGMAI